METETSTNHHLTASAIPFQNNTETEATVLATFINYPDSYFNFESTISLETFENKAHQAIYAAIKKCGENSKIDLITVKDALVQSGFANYSNNVLNYVDEICYHVATDEHLEEHIKLLQRHTLSRGLIRMLLQAHQNLTIDKMEPDDVVNFVSEKLIKITESGRAATEFDLNKTLYEVTKDIENKTSNNGLPTWLAELDEFLLQCDYGDTVVIAAPPGVGKSSFLLDLARRSIQRDGEGFLIFSLETGKNALVKKLIAAEGDIAQDAIRRRTLTPQQWERYHEALGRLQNKKLFIEDDVFDIFPIIAKIKYYVVRYGVKKVGIDYIQLAEVSLGKGASREQEISRITRLLKKTAQQLGIIIFELSQLSREVGKRANKEPMLSDLRESGAIEQDAVRVIFLYWEDYYNPEARFLGEIIQIKVILAKSRNTALGSFYINFNKAYSKFISKYDTPTFPVNYNSLRLPSGNSTFEHESPDIEPIDYFPDHAQKDSNTQQTPSQDTKNCPF